MFHLINKKFDAQTTVILTPNKRLASELHKEHGLLQKQSGKKIWQSILIMPLTSWLLNLWQEISSNQLNYDIEIKPSLLTTNQEQLIWQKIISNSQYNDNLINIRWLAQNTQQAWNLIHTGQIPIIELHKYNSETTITLNEWINQFIAYCKKNNFISLVQLPNVLCKIITRNNLPKIQHNHWILVGFDQISPQINAFLKAFEAYDYKIEYLDPNQTSEIKNRVRITFDNLQEEILSMARWAKQLYTQNPNKRIACVVPKLTSYRDQIEHIFQEVFSNPAEFNISLGKPLIAYSNIKTALKLIKIAFNNQITLQSVLELLKTPFILGAETEMLTRAKCESKLRTTKKLAFSWLDLEKYVNKNSLFINILENVLTFSILHKQKSYNLHNWANIFSDILKKFGWPGERTLTSTEYQTVKRWQGLLEEFSSLDLTDDQIHFHEAHSILFELAKNTIFQPEQATNSVNILGVLEAAGLNFDHLWLMDVDQDTWPISTSINPLLPHALQKKYNLPYSSPEKTLEFAQNLTNRFLNSSPDIICSYVKGNEEETRKIHHLLENIPEINISEISLFPYTSRIEQIYQSTKLESYEDKFDSKSFTAKTNQEKTAFSASIDSEIEQDSAVVTQSMNAIEKHGIETKNFDDYNEPGRDEGSPQTVKLRGGSNILKLQSLCPFRAFAEYRLNTKKINEPQLGLAKNDRGTLIHEILENIWNQLNKDQKALCNLNNSELENLIETNINRALVTLQNQYNSTFLEIEHACLTKLLKEWLEIEKQRPPFKIIETENTTEVEILGMKLSLRLDRIDKLEDGSLVIIDYKTGKNVNINDWIGERPSDPQLPLYCITAKDSITGIMFAHINLNKMGFIGVTSTKQDISGVSELEKFAQSKTGKQANLPNNWEALCQEWRKNIERLAQEYLAGKADVDPKFNACDTCHLKILCRKIN